MSQIITSTKNEQVKRLRLLQQKSQFRSRENTFVVEGRREVERCMGAGFRITALWVCPEIAGTAAFADKVAESSHGDYALHLVSGNVYEAIAYRSGTEGVIAEVEIRPQSLNDITFKSEPLLVVLESVEKPGNLGAVIRSADAAGADAVIVCDPLTDLYNPNLIRASTGGIFTVKTVACSSADCIEWLRTHRIQILTAQLQNSLPYYSTDMRRPTAIVMGTEATGLTRIWRNAADRHILIPMLGSLDSLNVSVSTAILLYEAVRQRMSYTNHQ